MSIPVAGGRRLSSFVVLAALYLAGVASLWLAGRFAHALLFEQAEQRVAIWASGATPFDVDFSDPEAVIAAGSEGIDDAGVGPDGLALQSKGKPIALALRLPVGGLMKSRLASVTLSGEASTPANWQLIGFSPTARDMATLASGRFGATAVSATSSLVAADWPIGAMQLRLEAPDGTEVRLLSLRFKPDFPPNTEARCGYQESTDRLIRCEDGVVRMTAFPGAHLGDTFRRIDAGYELSPGMAVEPARSQSAFANLTTEAMRGWLRLVRSDTGTALIYAAVVLLSLLAVLLARRDRNRASRFGIAALPLLLAAFLLPASGLPDNTERPALFAVFGFWVAAAVWLGSRIQGTRSETIRWIGDRRAWRAALWFTLAGGGLLLLLSDGTWHPPAFDAALRYLPWVALQQWLLQRLIRPAAESWTHERIAVISLGALCFALLHFPNQWLMLLSGIGAAGWVWLGQRHRALLPLILSHWLLGLAALTLLSPTLLRNAEIGSRFLLQR